MSTTCHLRRGNLELLALLLSGAAFLAPASAGAAEVGAAPPAAAASAPAAAARGEQRIEITGSALVDDSRDAIASKLVVSGADIARQGDTSLADVLRRVPGITVTGAQGKGGEVRMRGLGSGYTQFLVNGEPAPAGFSIDSISPAQVERIEVARVATVDLGGQAIAGTINIVLKQASRTAQREIKFGVASEGGRPAASVDAQWGQRSGELAYALGAGLSERRDQAPVSMLQQATDAAGAPSLERRIDRRSFATEQRVSLTPSLVWQAGPSDKLSLDGVLRRSRVDTESAQERQALLGPPPNYASDALQRRSNVTFMQSRLNWSHTLGSEATIEAKLAGHVLRRVTETALNYFDTRHALLIDEQVHADSVEHSLNAAGKLRLPYLQGHAVALGWDGERGTRSEDRTQRQTSPVGAPTLDQDDAFDASVSRLALFVQDEWDVDETLSVYAGVRWAGLNTRADSPGVASTVNRFSAYSPVLQALWKPPGARGDQFRLGLSRSYRPPRTRDLIARRYIALENTPTTPDLQGNPELRPELAWGLDIAYEHYLPRDGGMFGVNANARYIEDVILDRLFFDKGWVSTRFNNGRARVYSLELESRLRLRALWPEAPGVEGRMNASRNWSRVQAVPGPDNRLGSQVPWAFNLGADWRLDGVPLTLGTSLGWQAGVRARTAATDFSSSSLKRTLDLYALWRVDPGLQLRLAVANGLHQPYRTTDLHTDAAGTFLQTERALTYSTVRLTLELKL